MADSNYIISKLESHSVPHDDAVILAAVVQGESSYNAGAIGHYSGVYYIGLFQISLAAHADKLKKWTSSGDQNIWISWLSNADNNIYAGARVYLSQGLGAWQVYTEGTYRQYLGKNFTINNTAVSTTSQNTVSNANQFVDLVRAQVGKPYVTGAEGPSSFDCSGLVQYIWSQFGVQISRTTYTQWPECYEIEQSQMQPGDLMFARFGADGNSGPAHVGIYIGNNRVVHAADQSRGVIEYDVSQFGIFKAARHPGMTSTLLSGGTTNSSDLFKPLTMPQTNYQVVPGSETYRDILYGRRYRVFIADQNDNNALDVSQLRCTFNCVKSIMEAAYSEVTIYNLSPATENEIIKEGFKIYLEAGYEGSQYGQVFYGNIIQPIRDKEGGTTYKLILIAMDSDLFRISGMSNFSIVRGQNSRSIIEQVANNSTVSAQLGNISQSLSDVRLTRGKVVFGLSQDYLRQLAQSENATFYMEDGKINIIKATDLPENEIFDLSPSSGLIGVPVQNDLGATIKMLLNPRVKLGTYLHIDNSLIRNQQYQQGQVPRVLDQDGIYRVIKVTHTGDTRGNDWYTEVETITQAGGDIPSIMTNGNTNLWGG